MKKIPLLFLAALLVLSCSSDNVRYKNPFIPNYSFSLDINEDLPLYSGLKSPVNPVYISNGVAGVKGIIVMRMSDTDYRVWEASCPNHYPSDCSRMDISGTNAVCPCEDYTYSLFTGVGDGEYTMKPYRVQIISPTAIRVYN